MIYKKKLINIKNFIFDVDGVFTDGSIIVDSEGNEMRVFNTKDGIAVKFATDIGYNICVCLLYTSPSPRDAESSRMPSSA